MKGKLPRAQHKANRDGSKLDCHGYSLSVIRGSVLRSAAGGASSLGAITQMIAQKKARHLPNPPRLYLALRYSKGVTMRDPLYVPRVSKSLSPATRKSAFARAAHSRRAQSPQGMVGSPINGNYFGTQSCPACKTTPHRLRRTCGSRSAHMFYLCGDYYFSLP